MVLPFFTVAFLPLVTGYRLLSSNLSGKGGLLFWEESVLLTERLEGDSQADLVPMGVVGVIPTKVCLEGGAIHRGDLLVTSSTPGYAMKGEESHLKIGMVLGKALEDFTPGSNGLIKVLVNVR